MKNCIVNMGLWCDGVKSRKWELVVVEIWFGMVVFEWWNVWGYFLVVWFLRFWRIFDDKVCMGLYYWCDWLLLE